MGNKIKSLRELFARLPANGRVRHLLRNFNLGMVGGKPPSVHKLALELGVDVYLIELPRNVRGRLVTDTFSDSGYAVEINRADDVRVRRWTLLHELVHFLIHRPDDPFAPALNRANGSHLYLAHELKQEAEANEFAEALVFGDGALEAALGLFGEDLHELARHFGVTRSVMQIALKKRGGQ